MTRSTDNAIVWRWDHDPFGNGVPNEDPDANGLSVTFNLRFPGQYVDSETGLVYNWNRYYDPQSGRYITSDPIGLGGGINTYGYGNGNPLMAIDPNGLSALGEVGAFFGRWGGRVGGGVAGEVVFPAGGGVPGAIIGGYAGAAGGRALGDWADGMIFPVPPAIPDPAVQEEIEEKVKSCPPGDKDPCKGLRFELNDHERKLREYMANPMAGDNRGFLAYALAKNDQGLYNKIYQGRIASLQSQISNFKKLLEECERQNGR
jgi:RHS repeat-associated protein